MIFLLTFLGLTLLWLTHYVDASTKYGKDFKFLVWLKSEIAPLLITIITGVVGVLILNGSALQGQTIQAMGITLRADYCLAFLSGYMGTGLIARLSSIIGNIASPSDPQPETKSNSL